ncbi:hypothetical protein Tco_0359319 [Tanacetum coccineum]
MIDSCLENIDHTQIKIPSPVPIAQLFNNFIDSPDVLEMDDLESYNESIDTPLVSLFLDSDDELDDGEVLNELDELYLLRRVQKFFGFSLERFLDEDFASLSCFFSIIEQNQGIIMEYLVNISKRRAFWSLNEDILKITILTTNTPYPSRKIRRIRACTHQRPQRKLVQYVVSREDQYAVLKL